MIAPKLTTQIGLKLITAIILLSISSIATTASAANKLKVGKAKQPFCSDSDGGKNYLLKGKIKTASTPKGKDDYCYTFPEGKTYLFEGRCINKKYQAIQKNCAELGNYSCVSGACILNNTTILVSDEDNKLIANSIIELYSEKNNQKKLIQTSATNKKGEAYIYIDGGTNEEYQVLTKKEGLISTIANVYFNNTKGENIFSIQMKKSPPNETSTSWNNFNFPKLTVELKEPIRTVIANEPYSLIYGLRFNPATLPTISKIDSHLVITKSDMISKDVIHEQTQKQIDFTKPQTFSLTLPEGTYGYYFYFDLTYTDGKKETFPKPYETMEYYFANGYPSLGIAYNFAVTPSFTEADCLPLIEKQKNLDKDKINILFVNMGEDNNTFLGIAKQITSGKYGPLALEPFSSNKDKLQFWYSTKGINSLSDLGNSEQLSYELVNGTKKMNELPQSEKIKRSCYLPNRQIIYINKSNNLWAVKCVDGYIRIETGREKLDACLKDKTKEFCYDVLRYDAIFSHEFGHQIAALTEEYTTDKLLLPNDYVAKFNKPYGMSDPLRSYNSFYSFITKPTNNCTYGPYGNYQCQPNEAIKKDCLQNSQWKDLIGNGCGKNGVVDCDPLSSEGALEVTCNNMGGGSPAYANLLKPTRVGIMGDIDNFSSSNRLMNIACAYTNDAYPMTACNTTYEPKNRLYGLVNERQICRYLSLYTGSSGGICDQFKK